MTTKSKRGVACTITALSLLIDQLKPDHESAALLKSGTVGLVQQVVSAGHTDAVAFAVDYLLTEGLSKIEFLDFGIDKAAVALEKFREAEVLCEATNKRLAKRCYTTGFSPESVIDTAAAKISSLVGEFKWDDAVRYFGFGNGASTRLTRGQGRAPYKYSGTPEVTPHAEALAIAAMTLVPSWNAGICPLTGQSLPADPQVSTVWGNRLDTVPKNAKTDRMIAIEPCMNMYLQKGLGGVIREKLKRVRVNLDDQGKNQHLALVGSRDGSLATIDLRMASDTVSQQLVSRLLPESWVDAIEQTRSHHAVLPDGTLHKYHKVSSMGNGFTFELESLIFWGLLQACLELYGGEDQRFAVYGDDIICPRSIAPSLLWVLEYCGFSANEKKTFLDGPFRESCGKHYFEGVDVTPFYFKEALCTDAAVYRVYNRYREWKTRLFGWSEDPFSEYLKSLVRSPALIPAGIGDCGFLAEFDEAVPLPYRRGEGFEGWIVRVLLPRAVPTRSPPPGSGRFTAALLDSGSAKSVRQLLREAQRGRKRQTLSREHLEVHFGMRYGRTVVTQWKSPTWG